MEYDIALLKSWRQDCPAERANLKLTTSAKIAAWSTLAFLIGAGVMFAVGLSGNPCLLSDHAGAIFVVLAVGFGVSLIAAAILTQKSKTRPVLCSSCKRPMETVVLYRTQEDMSDALADWAKWYTSNVFSDGVCGWKPKKKFYGGQTVIQLYWTLPRELWRVCRNCQKAFLDQADGSLPGVKGLVSGSNSSWELP